MTWREKLDRATSGLQRRARDGVWVAAAPGLCALLYAGIADAMNYPYGPAAVAAAAVVGATLQAAVLADSYAVMREVQPETVEVARVFD